MDYSKDSGEELPAFVAHILSQPLPQHEDSFYAPRDQAYYVHSGSQWEPVSADEPTAAPSSEAPPTKITLITWNIDMLIPAAEARMAAALAHLESLVAAAPADEPCVIFLQEMLASDMAQIAAAPWVRARFLASDVDRANWLSPLYGTATLVDRRLRVARIFRVRYVSRWERDALFVDVAVKAPRGAAAGGSSGGGGGDDDDGGAPVLLRLCNTHLESLVANPPVRPMQLKAAAPYMHDAAVHGALLAGDLNAIQPFDRTLHSENGLEDAYLALGGQEDSEDGYTWGYQCPQWMRDKFGRSRLDKVLFCGKVKPLSLEKIGVGVRMTEKVADDVMEELIKKGGGDWVTDHYGLLCRVQMEAP
jgi:tyrosyl-DNA phosphodiesterase 2